MLTFDHHTLGQRVLFGVGAAAENVAAAVRELGAERLLLIAENSITALPDEIAEHLPVVAWISEIAQHVPADNARAAIALAQTEAADAVVSVGGGSATGLAKIVARDLGLPIVAVPTTFAGSEATDVWGLTEDNRKVTGIDARVLPKVIVYDASLTASLPVQLAMASGLNALAHAVDGFWAPRADPINTALGTEALSALHGGLTALDRNPEDLEARERALYGAYLAATAFASAGSGMHHKICHVLGGTFGLSHAEMHAVVLPYVTAFNTPYAPDAAARVAKSVEGRDGASAATRLFDFRTALGVVGSLKDLGLEESDIPLAAQLSLKAIPTSNPRNVTITDVEALIRAAWAGEPPDS